MQYLLATTVPICNSGKCATCRGVTFDTVSRGNPPSRFRIRMMSLSWFRDLRAPAPNTNQSLNQSGKPKHPRRHSDSVVNGDRGIGRVSSSLMLLPTLPEAHRLFPVTLFFLTSCAVLDPGLICCGCRSIRPQIQRINLRAT